MATNQAVTKDDLKNALNEVVAHLTKFVQESIAASEARITAVMEHRFAESDKKTAESRNEINHRFDGVDKRFDGVDKRLDGVDKRLDGVDKRLDGVDKRLDGVDKRFDGVDKRLDGVDKRFDGVDKRFDGVDKRFDGVDKRFRRADRQRQAFREEVMNRFHEIEGKIMNRFDRAEQHTNEALAQLSREVTTKLDGHATVIDTFRVEQLTMGKIQDELRDDLEKANNANGAEIKDLKRRVTRLEEKILSKEN